jgi:hypothetical protein
MVSRVATDAEAAHRDLYGWMTGGRIERVLSREADRPIAAEEMGIRTG